MLGILRRRQTHRLVVGALALMVCGWASPGGAVAAEQQTRKSPSKTTRTRAAKGSPTAARAAAPTSVKRVAPVRRARPARRTRASVRARLEAEAREPRFKLSESGEVVPDIRAEAAIVYNPSTQQVLWSEHATDQRSIASITKVMTAVVALDYELDTGREVVIERQDVYRANHTYLRARDVISIEDLLHLALIGSDNAAARAIARTSILGSEAFVARMNQKAAELGLEHTSYVDPSGLDAGNVSSAYDMARLIAFVSGHERIAAIMRMSDTVVQAGRHSVVVRSTNKLLGSEVDVRAGKTGFISKAGYCLATLLRLPQGDQVAVVVLGAKSNAGRFWETRHIINWISSRAGLMLETPALQHQGTPQE